MCVEAGVGIVTDTFVYCPVSVHQPLTCFFFGFLCLDTVDWVESHYN